MSDNEISRLRRENDVLRGLLGNSAKDCPHCGLAAADQAKCAHGFPGCPRADDQQLGEYFAAGYVVEQLRLELSRTMVVVEAAKRVPLGDSYGNLVPWEHHLRDALIDFEAGE